jgi:hypothetical protein
VFRKTIAIVAACMCSSACADESHERAFSCDGSEQCVVNVDGTCSPCCCPVPGVAYELGTDPTCKRQELEGTLECYARAGSSEDFPDVCGSSPATVCLERRTDDQLDVRKLPYIPIGWSGLSDWDSCSAEAAEAIRSTTLCE